MLIQGRYVKRDDNKALEYLKKYQQSINRPGLADKTNLINSQS